MGAPKGLLDLGGVPLLVAHIRAFRGAGLPVAVVLGARAEDHRRVIPEGVRVYVNKAWETTGLAESASLALADADVALLTPVDVPPARPETLAALLSVKGDAVPTWSGLDGHPVRLTPPHPPGARLDHRLVGARRVPVADPDCILNLNTPEEWARWCAGRRA